MTVVRMDLIEGTEGGEVVLEAEGVLNSSKFLGPQW
jgi:hypothetical protein